MTEVEPVEQAWNRLRSEDDVTLVVAAIRKALDDAGMVFITTDALKEIVGHFEEEVSCPYCAEWNTVTVSRQDEECEVTCIGCGGVFNLSLVQYLTAEGI